METFRYINFKLLTLIHRKIYITNLKKKKKCLLTYYLKKFHRNLIMFIILRLFVIKITLTLFINIIR